MHKCSKTSWSSVVYSDTMTTNCISKFWDKLDSLSCLCPQPITWLKAVLWRSTNTCRSKDSPTFLPSATAVTSMKPRRHTTRTGMLVLPLATLPTVWVGSSWQHIGQVHTHTQCSLYKLKDYFQLFPLALTNRPILSGYHSLLPRDQSDVLNLGCQATRPCCWRWAETTAWARLTASSCHVAWWLCLRAVTCCCGRAGGSWSRNNRYPERTVPHLAFTCSAVHSVYTQTIKMMLLFSSLISFFIWLFLIKMFRVHLSHPSAAES